VKILFLGGTGNLSTACAREAISRGHELAVLSRGEREDDLPEGVERIRGDIQDAVLLGELAKRGLDVVVDFIAFVAADVERDIEAFAGHVGQYVFVSSASVYEKPPRHYILTEETPLGNSFWQYSRDKIDAEQVLMEAHRRGGFPVTIVRPSFTYGDTWIPTTTGVDYTVVWRMRRGLEVVVPGDGTSLWTLTHASDFAQGFVGLFGQPAAIGEAFQVTSDEVLTWDQIYQTIARVLDVTPKLVHVPSDVIARVDASRGMSLFGDKAYSTVFDNSKLKRVVVDFQSRVPFEVGIRRSIAWFEADPKRQRIDANAGVEKVLAAWTRAMVAFDGA